MNENFQSLEIPGKNWLQFKYVTAHKQPVALGEMSCISASKLTIHITSNFFIHYLSCKVTVINQKYNKPFTVQHKMYFEIKLTCAEYSAVQWKIGSLGLHLLHVTNTNATEPTTWISKRSS